MEYVEVYNSLDGDLSDHFKLQLSMVHGSERRSVTIRFPRAQRQLPGTNRCGPMVCSYMAERLMDVSPHRVLFVKEQKQRDWLHAVLDTGKMTICPKRRGKKPETAWTREKPDLLITVENAVAIRVRLSDLPNRPIFSWAA